MEINYEDWIKILMALLLGGAIGFEREFRDKAAGFRTLIFICLGSTLFTILSVKLAGAGDTRFGGEGDATRIASNIVAGVGFLGAGVILRENGRVIGLTTAAAVWLVAALGMAIGAADHSLALFVTAVTLVVLWIFPQFEHWIDRFREERNYEIVCALESCAYPALQRSVLEHGLRLLRTQQAKRGDRVVYCLKVSGPLPAHDRFVDQLLVDAKVEELKY